ncbi:MAG: bifunctional alpha/beta hydrolase/class I SAM-dependent methyltransferase [Pseudomonadota bacterium]
MNSPSSAWTCHEAGFESHDQTRLFYRAWYPRQPRVGTPRRALILLHRGHEHSGRLQPLVEDLGFTQDWAFAWDARGHGHSPGERGDAASFSTLVQDFDCFVRHLSERHGIALQDMVIVANSVGAVIAATWVHDHAPPVRGMVMAAAAFDINLYVPLAKTFLGLALRFQPSLFVTSYIRASMLTHSTEQAQAYDADPLITKNIAARVLLDLAHVAQRVVADAGAIDTPVLMLVAERDHVVKQGPQRAFFSRLASGLKRWVVLKDCKHAIFCETPAVRNEALAETRSFIEACYLRAAAPPERLLSADVASASAQHYQALERDDVGPLPVRVFYAVQRALLGSVGRLSEGMRIGHAHGFDSGASLDYVYRNQAQGRWGVGKVIDRGYLDAIGWRGIRLRREQLQHTLSRLIAEHPVEQPLRILDIAAGGGRYLLETVKRFGERDIQLHLRDFAPHNVAQAAELAGTLGLGGSVHVERRDAFAVPVEPDLLIQDETEADTFDIVVVSGLYELFPDNVRVLRSLRQVARQLKVGGQLVYTAQPWHPQLVLIAKTLTNHEGKPWRMRPRPQAEMDALVASVGLRKTTTLIGLDGIFTVSVARRDAPSVEPLFPVDVGLGEDSGLGSDWSPAL